MQVHTKVPKWELGLRGKGVLLCYQSLFSMDQAWEMASMVQHTTLRFAALSLLFCSWILADRAIPDDNLAYPVLVTIESAAEGSGFFFNTRSKTFFVTASHVLYDQRSGKLKGATAVLRSFSKNPKEMEMNELKLDLTVLSGSGLLKKHSTDDVALVEIGTHTAPAEREPNMIKLSPGVLKIRMAPSGILGVSIGAVKRFGEILTANQVYVFGYPRSLGLAQTRQIDPDRPLLRLGIVAGTNNAQRSIVIDCPSYPGNSGGPVLEVEDKGLGNRQFRVIGIVTQFVPFVETWRNVTQNYQNVSVSNSGYSIAASIDSVLELIPSEQY